MGERTMAMASRANVVMLLLSCALAASEPTNLTNCKSLLFKAQNDALLCHQMPNPQSPGFCQILVPEIMGCCASNRTWQSVQPAFEPQGWSELHQACDLIASNDAPIHCEWGAATAPFYISVDNQATEPIKLRSCPKKYSQCTGDATQPNRYFDCQDQLAGSTVSSVLINEGVGYLAVVYTKTGRTFQVNPLIPGGDAWAGKIKVPA